VGPHRDGVGCPSEFYGPTRSIDPGSSGSAIDIDRNVFAPPIETRQVLDALPVEIVASADDGSQLMTIGQCRLLFDGIPVDIFLDTTPFHDLRVHVRAHPPAGRKLPLLGGNDLADFEAFFDRRKDWADIEEVLRAGRLDVPYVVGLLSGFLDPDDERIRELVAIREEIAGETEP